MTGAARAAALVLLFAGRVVAEGKPKLAIVIDPKDLGSIKLTDAMVAQIRVLASKKAERFTVAATPKQVTAVSRTAECKAIEPACAAKIGEQLGVDYVLSGEIETRGTHRVLTAALVKVEKKQRTRSLRDVVASDVQAKKWAQKVYERIVAADTGDLTIIANAQRGEVLLDGQLFSALFDGKTTLQGIAVGTHALGIRAPGYKPLDIDVTIDGSANRETVLLDPLP